MKNKVFCCSSEQACKVYELPTKRFWKRLYFLDECKFCGQPIAVLKECNWFGQVKILKRYSGHMATRLRDTLITKREIWGNPQTGSYTNEIILFNNKGIIYNFNNRRVGKNEDFLLNVI